MSARLISTVGIPTGKLTEAKPGRPCRGACALASLLDVVVGECAV